MRKSMIVTIAALLISGAAQLSAQGIVVYKTDGTKVYFPAGEVEKVGTYDYGENPQPEPGTGETKTYTANGVSFTMIGVEGGTFQMGATSEQGNDAFDWEKPTHQVTVSSFSIGLTEVTQALWYAVMGQKPTTDGNQWSSTYGLGDNRPAYYVSWNDCQEFITKLNQITGQQFRLPTEAEWEFAARGRIHNGCIYSGSNYLDAVAWFYRNGLRGPQPVKRKQPNELGLYDMSGNLCEWCQDWYSSDYYANSPSKNPKGPSSGSCRVLRSGSLGSDAKYCRVSSRGYNTPDDWSRYYGFRLALSW